MWSKFKASFKNSATIVWARIVALSGTIGAIAAPLVTNDTVVEAAKSLLQPKFIPYYVIGIGVVTELFRRRTAGDPPATS
jgi:hypothetical protein